MILYNLKEKIFYVKTINKISIKTIISLILVCALSITGIFSITAYAENIYQGGNIVSTGTYCGGEFSSGSNNKLTVRAMATNVYGSPNNVKLTL